MKYIIINFLQHFIKVCIRSEILLKTHLQFSTKKNFSIACKIHMENLMQFALKKLLISDIPKVSFYILFMGFSVVYDLIF